MIGLIVITHGQMAQECLRTAEMIIGPIACCRAISIDRSCSVGDATASLSQAVAEVGADGEGVLILTDMFGGTPTNIAADFLAVGQVDILTGVNLPMLVKAAGVRGQKDLVSLAGFLREYAQQAIMRPADLLKSKK
jgi:PTS system mannose-specific IIA component